MLDQVVLVWVVHYIQRRFDDNMFGVLGRSKNLHCMILDNSYYYRVVNCVMMNGDDDDDGGAVYYHDDCHERIFFCHVFAVL